MTVINNNAYLNTEEFWYHGFDYNATPGSRAQITTVLQIGYALCFDPEAYADDKTFYDTAAGSSVLPTGADYGKMILYPRAGDPTHAGANEARYIRNVTRPATALLGCFAGIITQVQNPTKWGAQAKGAGPHFVHLAKAGDVVMAKLNGSFSFGQRCLPANGSFLLVPWTVDNTNAGTIATSLTNFRFTCATALVSGTFDSTSAAQPVLIGGPNTLP